MGQGGGDGELHPHPLGKVLDLFVPGQPKLVQIAVKTALVPVPVGAGEDTPHLGGLQRVVEAGLVQHHADVLLKVRLCLRYRPAKDLDRAAVRADQI